MRMLARLLQSAKALLPMLSTETGMVMPVRPVVWKALSKMVSSFSGSVMDISLSQLSKALTPMVFTFSPSVTVISTTLSSSPAFQKAASPISVTPLPMVTLASLLAS